MLLAISLLFLVRFKYLVASRFKRIFRFLYILLWRIKHLRNFVDEGAEITIQIVQFLNRVVAPFPVQDKESSNCRLAFV